MDPYQALTQALIQTVDALHKLGLPHIAGILWPVHEVTSARSVFLVEDALDVVSKLFQLHPLPKAKARILQRYAVALGVALQDARYVEP